MHRHKFKKALIALIVGIIVAIAIIPFIIGAVIKHDYEQLIAFYNAQGNVQIKMLKYQRHWFSAKAKLSVAVNHPLLKKLAQILAEQQLILPQPLCFTVDQYIQYGPILYRKHTTQALAVELAYMYSEINLAPDVAKVIQPINVYEPVVIIVDNLSFSGKFHRDFRSVGFRVNFPSPDNRLEFHNLRANMFIWPGRGRIKGNIHTDDIILLSKDIHFIVPTIDITFDRQQSPSSLWVGDTDIMVPKIFGRDSNDTEVLFTNFVSRGSLSESDGLLSGARQFNLEKAQTDGMAIGPLHLQVSTHNLNAKATAELLSEYKNTLLQGGDFLGTTQFISNFPAMINNQSSIEINPLQVQTPNGNLTFTAAMSWPHLDASKPSLFNVLRKTTVQASLRIAQPLAKILLHIVAVFSNVQPSSSVVSADEKSKQTQTALRQYDLLIAMLTENHQLSAAVSAQLLKLAKQNISLDVYTQTLQTLLTNKQITADVVDTLRAQYAAIQYINMPAAQREAQAEKSLFEQLDDWLQEGYVTQDQDDYLTTLLYQDGMIKINGKVL